MRNKFFRKAFFFGIIFLFVGAGVIPSTGIIVEKTIDHIIGSPGYIQDLIDNASPGDTINIPSGTYYENIVIDKSIILVGEDKDKTIIDGGSEPVPVVYVSSDWVTISGFTIQNEGSWDSAGIQLASNHNTIKDNIISNNDDGIYLDESSDNTITNNNILSNNDDGIYLWSSINNTITGNNIKYNNVSINLLISSDNTITSNDIFFNSDDGIYLDESSDNTITNNNILFNNDNGIDLRSSSDNTITSNNIILNNRRGIQLYESNNNNITGNNIIWNYDGIYLWISSDNIIQKNNFINNIRSANFFDCKNTWYQNFWNAPRKLPKLIFGKVKLFFITIPWFNIDWFPAKAPYEI